MINKISFKNYKLFKEKQILELKPITILIGKNNSGKSAVLKLPTLIAGSFSSKSEEAIQTSNLGIKIGLTPSDLVYNKRTIQPLELDIESNDPKLEEIKLSILLPSKPKEKAEIFKWEYYENNSLKHEKKDKDKFRGFNNSNCKLKNFQINIDYIGAFRELPSDGYNYNNESHKRIGIKGENAYSILIQNSENGGEILENVSMWYQNNFEKWKIEVKDFATPTGTQYQIVLSNDSIQNINIVNTGQGINQALPLVVRSFMKDEEKVLIIIEEPETHLHPAAHGSLAERFVDSYLKDENKRYFIETHSQNFVLRLRALVAQGKLDPEDLAIYYVDFNDETNESVLKRIAVDKEGEVDWWPLNIFNESLKEVIEIRKAQNS